MLLRMMPQCTPMSPRKCAQRATATIAAMSSGVLQAALAYAMWGLFPLYFHLLSAVDALDIVLHRSLWSLAFLLVVLSVLRRWAWLREVIRRPRTLAIFAFS